MPDVLTRILGASLAMGAGAAHGYRVAWHRITHLIPRCC
jgi:hypothetical protein